MQRAAADRLKAGWDSIQIFCHADLLQAGNGFFTGFLFGHFLDRHKPFHHILKNGHIGKKIVELKNHGRIAADMKDFLFAGAFHINDGFLIKLKRPFISGSQKN